MIDDPQEFTPTLPDTEAINSQKIDFDQTLNYGWGSLVPVVCEGNLRITVLTEDCYTIGRSPTCNISLTAEKIKSTLTGKISKIHFKVLKSVIDDGTNIAYLEDLSSNGTFINGVKVGKNQRVILTSADEISLAVPSFKVFIFIEPRKCVEQWLNQDLSKSFLVLRHLGTGGFGDVKLVIDKKTFLKYAMKKVENGKERERSIFNEVNILKRLKHPCIIHFETIYETPEAVFITLEYMSGGNLLQRIHSEKKIPENECKVIFYQLILGVKYLHEEGIVHRDLKPENVLLEFRGKRNDIIVKITDFGLSKILHSATNLKTACGTLRYTAPEIIKVSSGNYSWKVDIWSLGVILFFCLSGELPFMDCLTANELAKAIVTGAYIMPPYRWQLISPNAIRLVRQMLTVNPVKRISSEEVFRHNWFKDNILKSRIQEIISGTFLNLNEPDENTNDILGYHDEQKRRKIE